METVSFWLGSTQHRGARGWILGLLGTRSPPGLSSFSPPAPLPYMMDLQRKEGKKNTLKPAACDSSLLYLHLLLERRKYSQSWNYRFSKQDCLFQHVLLLPITLMLWETDLHPH